ncbi:hypothetical protein B0H10DRAFT_657375 [Mycena sp. CBHHK59/15]|nr:hypothetical protein B0H10DRAFT_657375 [Mycena sp. CBHHK59/15]
MLETEVQNLHSILTACHSTRLETLALPGEVLLRSLDASFIWPPLRELRLEGFWPEIAPTSLLSVLRAMSNLRRARLQLGRSTDDLIAQHILPPDTSPLLDPSPLLNPDPFLSHLEQFEAASRLPGERILSTLSVGLETLSLRKYYDGLFKASFRSDVPSASAVFDMLTGVHCPNLKYLQLWHKIPA